MLIMSLSGKAGNKKMDFLALGMHTGNTHFIEVTCSHHLRSLT